ncbi:MAG: ABC transporter permease [Nitrospinota bacterium]
MQAELPALSRRAALYSKTLTENLGPIVLLLVVWELFARSGLIHSALFPTVTTIFWTVVELTREGKFGLHILHSFYRLFWSVAFAVVAGTALGILMGSFRPLEKLLVPPINFFAVIPGIALFPATLLWFGLTEKAVIFTIGFSATLPVVLNVWTGVKTVNETLVNAARSMETEGLSLLARVLLPGALPVVIAGYRIGFARAWRILVAGELLATPDWGLGIMIFEAREFLQSEVVYGGIIAIGIFGFAMERLVLRSLEISTVQRWGMLREL